MPGYYVAKTSDYWLRVQMSGGEAQSVPYGLKVQPLERKNGREYFQILEGVHNGKSASVSIRQRRSYLTDELTHSRGATLKFDRKSQTLYVGSLGPFNAFSGGDTWALRRCPSARIRSLFRPFHPRRHGVSMRNGRSTTTSGSASAPTSPDLVSFTPGRSRKAV